MRSSFFFVATTSVFFIVVAVAFLREGLSAPTCRVRNLAFLASGLSLQFATGAAWSSGIEAADLGWITGDTEQFIKDWLGLAVEVMALTAGVMALLVVSRADSSLHKAVRLTSILSQNVAGATRLADLPLTAREVQVLELMSNGTHTDQDLSRDLSISPATAATHIRNIMKKAGVSRRQDLLLLGDAEPEHLA